MEPKEIINYIDKLFAEKLISFENFIDEKIKSKTSLSIKYWYPTIITAIAFTSGLVYWYLSQENSVDKRITKLESFKTLDPSNVDVVKEFQYFNNISYDSNIGFSQSQLIDLKNIAFTLNNQRKDLVVILTGYTKNTKNITKEELITNSSIICDKIAKELISYNVESNRIFKQGRGPDVPDFFPGAKDQYNCCIMLCDLYNLLKSYANI